MRGTKPATLANLSLILTLLTACAPTVSHTDSPAPLEAPTKNPTQQTETSPIAPPEANSTLPALDSAPANPLPAGALTIVTLGDSLTAGDGDETGQGGYPPRLLQLIETWRPGSQVINLGHSGWTSGDVITGVNGEPSELRPALEAKPQLALVWIGSNDLWYLYEYGPDPITEEAEQQDLARYEANLDTILRELTNAGAKVYLALLDDQSKRPVVANPPNPAEPAFTATNADDLAHMSAHVSAYNEILQHVALKYGATPVDFYHTTIFTDPVSLYSDGNHPNPTGYDQITQIWFSAIEPALK
jgi:lysophospholipase L1-like esterase